MKVEFSSNELRIKWESDMEKDYVKTILNRIHCVYNPTYITWINGNRIEGKGEKK